MQLELWDQMRALERRMDDLFRTFLGPRARMEFPAMPTGLRRPFAPTTDVLAEDGDLVVRLELPGVDPSRDVKITIEDGELIVRGERKESKEVKEENYVRKETAYGAFERYVPVPEDTDEKKVKAEYADGILEIRLPAAAKGEPSRGRSIPIHTPETA